MFSWPSLEFCVRSPAWMDSGLWTPVVTEMHRHFHPTHIHKICIWSTWPIALNWHFKFMPNTNHTITNPKNWINANTLFVIFFCFFPYNCSVCWLTLFTSIYFISFLSFFLQYNNFCCELSIESNVNRSPYSICIWGHFSKRARSLSF